MARVQIFDDGSSLTLDDAGNVLGGVDMNGIPFAPAAPSPIVQQFSDLFNYGVTAGIAKIKAQIGPIAPAPVAPAAKRDRQLINLALLGAGAFLIYKLASG